ncbi:MULTISPECIES: hypothetical protein [Enterococcus]|uniref:Uncharacterized protein n=3 Tax=Enterococcus TaxID=1350 RepID=A0A2G0E8J2_ENTFC|nr:MULTISPECIES: hypothetical protein [Enterococcus]KXS06531.1 hypothetical protein AUC59_11600 [Enterococcus faecium]MBK4857551.1 hypothetical protein [Enterococcus faecium]MBK4873609.1 hypothetical protein [Enterococcus faecium]MBK4884371.1 hypothetical protein [Enterococcus faecium]MBL4996033.1 hypothetical protein [Enterococcus lactis]
MYKEKKSEELNNPLIVDEEKVKVSVDRDSSVEGFLMFNVENYTDKSVVLQVENLAINDQKQILNSESILEELANNLYGDRGQALLSNPSFGVFGHSLALEPARYDDSHSEDNIIYTYESTENRKRPGDLKGDLKFDLIVYTTDPGSLEYISKPEKMSEIFKKNIHLKNIN